MPQIYLPTRERPQVVVEASAGETILSLDSATIIELYKMHGALLFRGFGADVEQFRKFTRIFSATSVLNESPGRQAIDQDANIHTVDGGVREFSLHPELSREPWKPDMAMFCCLSAPSSGGQTTICDGVQLVRELPEQLRARLEGRRLLYIKATWPELLEFWLGTRSPSDQQLLSPPASCPYDFRRIDGQIVRIFTRPMLHRPMFIDAPAFGNFLLFARFNNNRPDFPLLDDGYPVPEAWLQGIKATGDRLKVAIDWRNGDVLMLDNTRFMHGRAAILDPGERLIATYFGYLRFALPDSEEPTDPIWRKQDFRPPFPPDLPR